MADDYPFTHLDADTVRMVARAFNDAMEQLHVADLDPPDRERIKALAAKRVMDVVAQGERDADRLRKAAMTYAQALN